MQITAIDTAEVCAQAEVEVLSKYTPAQIRRNWRDAMRLRIIMVTTKRLKPSGIPARAMKAIAEQIIELNAGRRHILQ